MVERQTGAPPSHKQAVRDKAAALRAKQATADRRRRALSRGGIVSLILVLVVGIGIAVQAGRNRTDTTASAPGGAVPNTDASAFALGQAGAPVTIDVYEDYQCPSCRAFEEAVGTTLEKLAGEGRAKVLYHPIAFLDKASTDRYSTRALNAAGCVSDDAGAEAFHRFAKSLYANQPAEGGAGLTSDRLIALAGEAGAGGDQTGQCVRDLRFEGWTRRVTDAASKAGINSTPTVQVNGRPLENPTAESVEAAVAAAGPS